MINLGDAGELQGSPSKGPFRYPIGLLDWKPGLLLLSRVLHRCPAHANSLKKLCPGLLVFIIHHSCFLCCWASTQTLAHCLHIPVRWCMIVVGSLKQPDQMLIVSQSRRQPAPAGFNVSAWRGPVLFVTAEEFCVAKCPNFEASCSAHLHRRRPLSPRVNSTTRPVLNPHPAHPAWPHSPLSARVSAPFPTPD